MKLARWYAPQVATFGRFAEELDRLFEAPLARTGQWLSGWNPALDVRENKENFVVRVEVPGMKKEDIDVSLVDGTLTISGERKQETEHKGTEVHRSERFYGRFERSIALPAAVASDRIGAQYKDGVLTITLPKTEPVKPKQVDIQIN